MSEHSKEDPGKSGKADDTFLTADPTVILLTLLLLIAILFICYTASEIVLPIVLAFILKLLFQPGMRFLENFRIPRSLAAVILIVLVFGTIVGLGAAVSGPATEWAKKLPEGIPRLEERLKFLSEPIGTLRTFLQKIDGGAGAATSSNGAFSGSGFLMSLFAGTTHFAGSFFETILILFFLLVSGNTFLRKTVEILPRFKDKRQAVAISQEVEQHISMYLVTITAMNLMVGLATAGVMWAVGLGDYILWGVVAFLLNFVPIMGPLLGVFMFLLAGLLALEPLWLALMPAVLYLLIHVVEGEIVTPSLLAKRFSLNPVLVIISLIFWFWMWGVPGAIMAVPMLAIAKIVCDSIRPLAAIGHYLGGED